MSMAISGMSTSPQVWSGASGRMSPTQKMTSLFQQIDSSGSGSITKAQFEQAFQTLNPPKGFKDMGADATFSKLDPKGTGSVSKQDFVSGMTSLMSQMHHAHHHHGGGSVTPAQTSTNSPQQTISTSMDTFNSLGLLENPSTNSPGTTVNTTV